MLYQKIIRPILFRLDAELVHDASIKKINKEWDQLLLANNFKHISQAVGREAHHYSL